MEEIEVPLEKVQEHINESAHHSQNSFINKIALFSALVAAIAAVAALIAGHHSNEAMISQIKSSDLWGQYQAKGIKSSILISKNQILQQLDKKTSADDEVKISEYKKEQEEISEKAKDLEKEAEEHLNSHVKMSRAVTLFQVAIAIAAISVLTKRRRYFFVSLGFAGIGLISFIIAFLK